MLKTLIQVYPTSVQELVYWYRCVTLTRNATAARTQMLHVSVAQTQLHSDTETPGPAHMSDRLVYEFSASYVAQTRDKFHIKLRVRVPLSLVKWRLTDWIEITGSNPNSCASLEYSGTRSWRCGSFVSRTSLAQQEKCCRTWNWSGKMI